jgi:DNA replication protein DnaC
VPREHEKFGKIFPCPQIEPGELYSDISGLTKNEIELMNWSQLMDFGDTDKAKNAVQATLGRGYGWVFLWGGPGLAKTLLLKIAVVNYLRVNKSASYQRMTSIMDNLRSAYDMEDGSSEALMRLGRWSDLPLLAIDEFDRIRDTPYAREKKFDLMDARYERALRKESITLMASNKNPQEFGDYLFDRINDGRFVVIEMHGDSLRPGMEWED